MLQILQLLATAATLAVAALGAVRHANVDAFVPDAKSRALRICVSGQVLQDVAGAPSVALPAFDLRRDFCRAFQNALRKGVTVAAMGFVPSTPGGSCQALHRVGLPS